MFIHIFPRNSHNFTVTSHTSFPEATTVFNYCYFTGYILTTIIFAKYTYICRSGTQKHNFHVLLFVSGWPQHKKRRHRRYNSRRVRAQLIEWVARARQEGRGLPRCSCSPKRTPYVDTHVSSSSGHILSCFKTIFKRCTHVSVS